MNVNTVTNWELNRTAPALRFIPKIIQFLGYVTCDATRDSSPLAHQLKAYRRIQGLSQKRVAAALGVDEGTLRRWERGTSTPRGRLKQRVQTLLATRVEINAATP